MSEPEKKEQAEVPQSMKILMDLANRYNGYPYIAVCNITKYDDKDESSHSSLIREIRSAFILTGRGNLEEFKKTFVGAPIAYVRAYQRCPTMAKDGCYTCLDIEGKPIPYKICAEYALKDASKFGPFILVKQGPGKFGVIEGNPYHQVTREEVASILKTEADREKEAAQK